MPNLAPQRPIFAKVCTRRPKPEEAYDSKFNWNTSNETRRAVLRANFVGGQAKLQILKTDKQQEGMSAIDKREKLKHLKNFLQRQASSYKTLEAPNELYSDRTANTNT